MTAGQWFAAIILLLGLWSPFLVAGTYWLGYRSGQKSCTASDEMEQGGEGEDE